MKGLRTLPEFDYVGMCPRGHVLALISDAGDAYTAREVADWVKGGLTIGRMTRAEAVDKHIAGGPEHVAECMKAATGEAGHRNDTASRQMTLDGGADHG